MRIGSERCVSYPNASWCLNKLFNFLQSRASGTSTSLRLATDEIILKSSRVNWIRGSLLLSCDFFSFRNSYFFTSYSNVTLLLCYPSLWGHILYIPLAPPLPPQSLPPDLLFLFISFSLRRGPYSPLPSKVRAGLSPDPLDPSSGRPSAISPPLN